MKGLNKDILATIKAALEAYDGTGRNAALRWLALQEGVDEAMSWDSFYMACSQAIGSAGTFQMRKGEGGRIAYNFAIDNRITREQVIALIRAWLAKVNNQKRTYYNEADIMAALSAREARSPEGAKVVARTMQHGLEVDVWSDGVIGERNDA